MVMSKNQYILIGPFKEALTMEGLPLKGALRDSELKVIRHAGILMEGRTIKAVDDFETLQREAAKLSATVITLKADMVVTPGWVDVHTHIAFAGTRAHDFGLRNAGSSYLEIAESGGGIWSTVKDTRQATEDELVSLILERANCLIRQGITTIEVKSGYGLNVGEELKILRAIQKAGTICKATLVSTCLAAHTLPKDYTGTHVEYLELMANELFPILKAEGLTKRIDAFIEKSAFSKEQIAPYFTRAKEMEFELTVHADQFSTSGSKVAVAFGARSADHLECSGEEEIRELAASDVVSVALPGASLGIGCAFTPARRLLDAGASLAIASDWNPGSAPMGQLMTQASILATFEKLSNAEVFAGLTFRAGAALGLEDRGVLAPGYRADFAIYETAHIEEITYLQGQMNPVQVWIGGERVSG
jgi:imidazolonepropionase